MQSIHDKNNYDLDPTLEPLLATATMRAVPQTQATRPKRLINHHPLQRATLAKTAPVYWLILAGIALVFSSISTIVQSQRFVAFLAPTIAPWVGIAVGVCAVLIIFWGELYTSEYLPVYLCFLAVDVAFTLSWSWGSFYKISTALDFGTAGAFVLGVTVSAFAAWLPERVLLGQRRKAA